MFEIVVEDYFSAAHRLREYKGKCENLHGHNWKVQVRIGAKTLNRAGMVIDFKEVKEYLDKILLSLDHKVLNNLSFFKKHNPTSENTAIFIFNRLKRYLKNKKYQLVEVRVWESEKNSVIYRAP
jgi:6-pyruvoyltetrahydropterin/6-carboxytetrahydropterin synthase